MKFEDVGPRGGPDEVAVGGEVEEVAPCMEAVLHYGIHFRGVLPAGTGELGQVLVRHWDGQVLSVCTSLR